MRNSVSVLLREILYTTVYPNESLSEHSSIFHRAVELIGSHLRRTLSEEPSIRDGLTMYACTYLGGHVVIAPHRMRMKSRTGTG